MKSLLDNIDRTINPDQPLLQGLTNAGPANLGSPMPLPVPFVRPAQPEVGLFNATPNMLGAINAYDDEEDGIFPNTDPMHFEEDDIFETSDFLGIGNKAKRKARKAARQERRAKRKTARQEKRAARRAAKDKEIADIGADSPWQQANEITPESYGAQAQNTAAINKGVSPMMDKLNQAGSEAERLSEELNLKTSFAANQADLPEQGSNPNLNYPTKAKNKTMLYVGIGAAVLVLIIFVLKRKK